MSFFRLLREKTPFCCKPTHWPNQETVSTSILIVVNIACQILGSSLCVTIGLNAPVRLFSGMQALFFGKPYKVAMDVLGFGSLLFSHNRLVSIGIDTLSEAVNFCKKPKEKNELNLTKEFKMIPADFTDTHQPVIPSYGDNGEEGTKSYYSGLEESIKSTFNSYATSLWQQFQGLSLGQRIFASPSSPLSPFSPDSPFYTFFDPDSPVYAFSKRIEPSIHANACRILGIPEHETKNKDSIEKNYAKETRLLKKLQAKHTEPLFSITQVWIDDALVAYNTLIQGIE